MLFFLLLSFYPSPSASYDHDIYISLLEIDSRQMIIKVFTDDLQDAIRNETDDVIFSNPEEFISDNKKSVEGYFQKKIQLKINEKEINFSIEEAKLEGDSYWITFNLEAPMEWNSFYLEAEYFMELFPDQSNVVKVKSEKPQFYRLTKSNPSCSFTL